MDWRTALVTIYLVYQVNGYSKYGRTCKDIGCLNSEVCVLAEDPCSFGHTSNCGTYPTCKKKSQVEGSHSEPAPSVPKPVPQSPTRDFDSPPSYPAPAPPSNTHGSPYGNNPYGGGSPYGNNNQNGGGSPYGNNNHNGGGSPYGSQYGGSGGTNNPGGSYGGHSTYDNSPYGANSPYGGSSPYGGNSPYGRPNSNPNPSTGFGSTGGKGPLDNILNTLGNFANGGQGTPGGSSGQGLSNILGNILGNVSKGGGLSNLFNTRPIMENPNYSSYSSNSRSSNPQNYPAGSQQPAQNRNYGQNYASHNGAYTRQPSYGWNVSLTVILTYLIRQYVYHVIRD